MTIPLSETPTVGLGQFIKEFRFHVPSHQRDYSWKDEYINQFMDDIETAMREKDEIYFCGLMVFTKADAPTLQVLDGQQRLATTLMIFSAIRNWLQGYSAYQRAATQIEERYIGDSDLGETKMEPKLTLNAANNDAFNRYVIAATPVSDIEKAFKASKRGSRSAAILEAILLVNRRVSEKAASFDAPDKAKDYFLEFVTFITDTVQIVRLVVSGDEAAYTIFETLNDRGLDLAPLDLVKNYLFSRAEKSRNASALRDLEERWTEMMTLLEAVKANSFLRAFWASKHGVLEGRKLFKAFKKEYSDPKTAYQVSLDMRATAERYVALTDPNDAIWAGLPREARNSIEALKIIGATQTHPVILAAIGRFEARELQRLLRLLEVIAVRYQLVARGRPGRIESLGGRTARGISEKKITTASQVLQELRELYIPDDIFESDFATKIERENKKAAYLLKGLESQALKRSQDKHHGELAPDAVTVEHILPKFPGAGWKDVINLDTDIVDECTLRLGNMCLLSDVNRSLGNKSFDDKKKEFAASRIITTKSVSEYGLWSRPEIEERQKYMAKLAVTEWRFQ